MHTSGVRLSKGIIAPVTVIPGKMTSGRLCLYLAVSPTYLTKFSKSSPQGC
jgi:hypothetical protein